MGSLGGFRVSLRARPELPCCVGYTPLAYVAVVSVSFSQAGEAPETCEDFFPHASRTSLDCDHAGLLPVITNI